MHTELMVLIDESDACTKDQALHLLALRMAHHEAAQNHLSSTADAQAYANFVFPRCDEIEAKLRRIIAVGPP